MDPRLVFFLLLERLGSTWGAFLEHPASIIAVAMVRQDEPSERTSIVPRRFRSVWTSMSFSPPSGSGSAWGGVRAVTQGTVPRPELSACIQVGSGFPRPLRAAVPSCPRNHRLDDGSVDTKPCDGQDRTRRLVNPFLVPYPRQGHDQVLHQHLSVLRCLGSQGRILRGMRRTPGPRESPGDRGRAWSLVPA